MRLALKRANGVPFRHFFLFPILFILSGCLGLGNKASERYGYPTLPLMPETTGVISLSGSGAGVTMATSKPAPEASTGDASIAPQLEALTSEIRSMRNRFEAMEPAINRLVRMERDMTDLISEMELLANDPVPFTSPGNLFAPSKEALVGPAASPAGQATQPVDTPAFQPGGQTMPILSLGLANDGADAGSDAGTEPAKQAVAAPPPAMRTLPLPQGGEPRPVLTLPAPAQPTPAQPVPAQPVPADQAYPSSTVGSKAGNGRMAALPPQTTCDAFGIHVGSYLLEESIVVARVAIRERHAGVMSGLGYLLKEIDLRDGRGVFQRLIAGPIDDFEQASALCAAVESRGDYCKVTFFDPPGCAPLFN